MLGIKITNYFTLYLKIESKIISEIHGGKETKVICKSLRLTSCLLMLKVWLCSICTGIRYANTSICFKWLRKTLFAIYLHRGTELQFILLHYIRIIKHPHTGLHYNNTSLLSD